MRKTGSIFLVSLFSILISLLTGCTYYDQYYSQPPAPAVQYSVYGGAESAGMHTVSGDETLWDIAKRYRLPMQDIIHINKLKPPYVLADGQRLKLSAPREYTAKGADTLYTISRMFDVSTTELARLNGLQEPYAVMMGDVLRLPSPPPEPEMGPPLPPAQTSFSVATAAMPTEIPAPSPRKPVFRASRSVAVPSRAVQIETLASLPADTPPRSGSRFGWPVGGRIISGYGSKPGGLHNDGINISAAQGAPVRAAENGVVVYAGDQLKGFGNLVLIRHADRWMTAYAHMGSINVQRGEQVGRGMAIGTVGATGSVDGPQLHFEIRHGTEALNPEAYLDRQGI